MKSSKKTETVAFRVEEDIKYLLQSLANNFGVTVSELLRDIVTDYIEIEESI